MADLSEAEAEAHRAYSRTMARRLRRRPPNLALREARERAGLSKSELARRLGVALNTVWGWEAHGAHPRDPETRRQVVELVGCDPWDVEVEERE